LKYFTAPKLGPHVCSKKEKLTAFTSDAYAIFLGHVEGKKSETTLFCSSPIVAPCLVIAKQDGCTGLVTFAGLLSAVYQKTFSMLN